ncbi:MAG: universal stress protein [Gammaproteobacteria bacterium]
MTLRDILVHVDESKACGKRLEAAALLAQKHRARLTGLYVITPVPMPAYAGSALPTEVFERQKEATKAAAQEAESSFGTITQPYQLDTDWQLDKGDLADRISAHSRYADLLVIGQAERDVLGYAPGTSTQDRVVLECGRPVMLIPYSGSQETIGDRILVAWNGSLEAVRAINDALPLLKMAREVTLFAISSRSDAETENAMGNEDMRDHLTRHDVTVTAEVVQGKNRHAGNILLSNAAEHDTDLIVMGAYGHPRVCEWALGGATRHMLQHMTVPVLMSH